jgi:hypothetical protein
VLAASLELQRVEQVVGDVRVVSTLFGSDWLCELSEQMHKPMLTAGQSLALRFRHSRESFVFGLEVSGERPGEASACVRQPVSVIVVRSGLHHAGQGQQILVREGPGVHGRPRKRLVREE